jgi:putative polyhydroxyalkanoate system protein
MPDINIHRDHKLGLAKAREVAWQWAEEVEKKFDMECTVIEGETSDTVEFCRSGVNGRLIVAADHFDLNAKLGFLLGAFSRTIESEIEKNLDGLLAKSNKGSGKSAGNGGDKASNNATVKAAGKSTNKATPVARKSPGNSAKK